MGIGSIPHGQGAKPGFYTIDGYDGTAVCFVVIVCLKQFDEVNIIFYGSGTSLAVRFCDIRSAIGRSRIYFFSAKITVVFFIAAIKGEAKRSLANPVHQLFFCEISDVSFTADVMGFQNFDCFGMVEFHADGFHDFHGGFVKFLHSLCLIIHNLFSFLISLLLKV